MGVAITSVITMIYSVFTIFPTMPLVPLSVLGTVLKNSQLICGMPRTNTYPIIPINRRMENPAAM